MQRFGLGLFLHCFGGEQPAGISPVCSSGNMVSSTSSSGSPRTGTPTGGLDDHTLDGKYLTTCGQGHFGHFLDATWQEGFEQACGNHFIDSLLVLRQTFGQVLGDEKAHGGR